MNRGRRECRRFRAFTLVELLVIIAIIVILAAILFPVFAHSREKARQASCLSNCRQIGLAIMLYTQDWDETYPLYAHWPNHDHMWYEVVQPYTKNTNIFVCPSVRARNRDYGWNGYGVNYLHVIMYSQEWPPTWGRPKDPSLAGPQTVARLPRPTGTIMIGDAQADKGAGAGGGWPAVYCPIEWLAGVTNYRDQGLDKTWGLSDRHSGGGSYIFADGHVKWMRREAVINASLEPGQELWGHFYQ